MKGDETSLNIRESLNKMATSMKKMRKKFEGKVERNDKLGDLVFPAPSWTALQRISPMGIPPESVNAGLSQDGPAGCNHPLQQFPNIFGIFRNTHLRTS